MGRLFKFLQRVITPFLPRMRMEWQGDQPDGPCVFIGNHMGAMGPIYMLTRFPMRDEVAVWCNDGVMEEKLIVDYIRQDYWWNPKSVFAPLWNVTLPYIARAIVPKVMRSAPTIAVHHDNRIMTTMRESMKALKAGKHLIIFPEKPDGFDSHDEYLQMGWLNICTLYRKATGRDLPVVPVHIDPKGKRFLLGDPIHVDASLPLKDQEHAIERYLADGLRGK